MITLRKFINKPRPDDWAPLAKFYYADEALNDIASELDSFDGRRDPERCNGLVNKLRVAQDRILHIIHEMLVTLFPRESERACRDFRSKFPDEIVQDTLPGQLWFGAECLAAGSNIIDHESESDLIRPLAKELTRHLDHLRDLLKDQSLRDPSSYTEQIKDSLLKFDHLFANFEYHYVCAMVPVKSEKEHDALLDVAVLFSEVLDKALRKGHITQDQIDYCDPSVMLVIPRLGIVWGLLHYPEGALNVDSPQENLPEMFRPFHSLLTKIRNLLRILSPLELGKVEKVLCMGEPEATTNEEQSAFTISDFRAKARKRRCREKTAVETIMEGDNLVDDLEEDSECDDDELKPIVVVPEGAPPDPTNLRSRFRSSDDLIHRLFVCIAGVADQLQTNYSSDIRRVLKWILQPPEVIPVYEAKGQVASNPENDEEETGLEVQESLPLPSLIGVRWVPDEDCDQCTQCSEKFTMVRRRHHCRNCGRIFCHKCSANSISLPELGYEKKVRVCNLCYLHKMNPFGNCLPPSGIATPAPSSSGFSGVGPVHSQPNLQTTASRQ